MARAPAADNFPRKRPLVVALEIPKELRRGEGRVDVVAEAKARDDFLKTIRYHIAHNQSVIVREWYPERRYGFSVEDIGMLCPFMGQTVHWQGEDIFVLYQSVTC